MPRIRIVRHSELRCVLRSGPCRAEGSIEHVENCFALLQEAMTISECTRLAIHGPEDELAKLRKPMAHIDFLQYFTLRNSFRR